MAAIALVLGAGRGERLGASEPKALLALQGRSLIEWSARALARAPSVVAVLPVLPASHLHALDALRARWEERAPLCAPVQGGATRQESVARGLAAGRAALPDAEWVLVHDAARPLVVAGDAEQVLAAAQATGAAIPVAPLSDTLKRVGGGRVLETLDRAAFAAALTPQAFRTLLLAEALDKAARDGFVGTDCASLVERLCVEVRTCPGRSENFKVTGPDDLARAAAILGTGPR
jgi:2-C-methyl-D-erythritol 4-phosphate cytidylyltransferase/2-C-methyl-D-erythritol 2,4-cyclodiphosphate synthase